MIPCPTYRARSKFFHAAAYAADAQAASRRQRQPRGSGWRVEKVAQRAAPCRSAARQAFVQRARSAQCEQCAQPFRYLFFFFSAEDQRPQKVCFQFTVRAAASAMLSVHRTAVQQSCILRETAEANPI